MWMRVGRFEACACVRACVNRNVLMEARRNCASGCEKSWQSKTGAWKTKWNPHIPAGRQGAIVVGREAGAKLRAEAYAQEGAAAVRRAKHRGGVRWGALRKPQPHQCREEGEDGYLHRAQGARAHSACWEGGAHSVGCPWAAVMGWRRACVCRRGRVCECT